MGEDDVYRWWILGLNMKEKGFSQVFGGGLNWSRKAIQVMAQMHDKKTKQTETDTGTDQGTDRVK